MKKPYLIFLFSFFTFVMNAAPEFNTQYYVVKHKSKETPSNYYFGEYGSFMSTEIAVEIGDIFYGAVSENTHPTEGYYYHYAPDVSSTANSSSSVHCTITEGQLNLEHGITVSVAGTYTVYYDEANHAFSWTTAQDSVNDPFNGKEYVDLGLKDSNGKTIYWATCNIGAESPYEYGPYFAWGELEKCSQVSKDYNWADLGDDISGTQYDVARHQWGGKWRMPTEAEMQQLCDNCTWTKKTINGINGQEITGPNGNTIFLPSAGTITNSFVGNQIIGSDGCYWTSTCYYYMGSPYFGKYLWFGNGNGRVYNRDEANERNNGLTVRSVITIEESDPTPQKCATPTIAIENGKLQFSCDTENAEFQYTLQLSEQISGKSTGATDLPNSYSLKITVFATASGYENSEEATKTITIEHIIGDVNEDGKVTISDVTTLVDIISKYQISIQ